MRRTDLSFRAKGILNFILALLPNWKISESSLLAFPAKRAALSVTALKELSMEAVSCEQNLYFIYVVW